MILKWFIIEEVKINLNHQFTYTITITTKS